MQLNTVTISGIDDSVSISSILEIQQMFPFVEWGILLSDKRAGNSRYPSEKYLYKLANTKLKLSGHLCGNYVKQFLMGEDINIPFAFWKQLSRVQINFAGNFLPYNDRFINYILKNKDKQFIIQYNENVKEILEELLYYADNVQALIDGSCGQGKSPSNWPKPLPNVFCGYAGGLGPDNLESELERLTEVAGHNANIWIDMESKIRTNDALDLDKVVKCLMIASKKIHG